MVSAGMPLSQERPPVLYKYLPPERLTFVVDQLLRFTPPEVFNDPFDVAPVVTYAGREVVDSLDEADSPPQHLRLRLRQTMQRAYDSVLNRHISLVQFVAAESRGILSLSESCTSLLMWAHYADSHRGLVVGLSSAHQWLARAKRVAYTELRPIANVDIGSRLNSNSASSDAYLFEKSSEWCYEKEWRLLRRLRSKRESREMLLNSGPRSIELKKTLFRAPTAAIVELVIGARMTHENRSLLATYLRQRPRLAVKVYEAMLSPHRFRIELTPIERSAYLTRYPVESQRDGA